MGALLKYDTTALQVGPGSFCSVLRHSQLAADMLFLCFWGVAEVGNSIKEM